ncbi:MAG TPA: alanine--tRNA ligase [Candidatus Paceibacterota bacterium]|nr:alanine--tRNA ligase [Candidatus Paceibacterota bacterium]
MTLNEVRTKYLKFYEARGHAIIPSSSLVPQNDPTTLFTGSGMQPLVPYLLGKNHPAGSRVVDSQKCFRSGDIEEVGDNRHTTFFEMLGNWSLGDYFKQEQLPWFFNFLTDSVEGVGLDPHKLYVTTFIGDEKNNVPKDTESAEIWQRLFKEKGIDAAVAEIGSEEDGYQKGMKVGERIFYYDAKKNWWSRAGTPDKMPVGEPGGPDSEVFYDFGTPHDTKWGPQCHPNCDCGRFLEIGNSVFMQYIKKEDGTFGLLPKQNVDFGGGLERIIMAATNSPDIVIVNHAPIIEHLEKASDKPYASDMRSFRIIADHMKAAVFLIADGVKPSAADQGYFVRRLIRRSVRYADKLGIAESGFAQIVRPVVEMYKEQYPELVEKIADIETSISNEEEKFRKTLARGKKELERFTGNGSVSANDAFQLVTTFGFPLELIIEEAGERGIKQIDIEGFKELLKHHQDLSRAGSEQKFKGGLADTEDKTVRLHTAHHLLLKALQTVLGPEVKQRGSNITQERLRIDFNYDGKMTPEQLQAVEKLVNEKIDEDLPVIRSEMSKEKAETLGAEHEFGAKYPDMVSVYSIGPKTATQENPDFENRFSIEFCGGPHVTHTGELLKTGHFKIQKEEAVSAGVRRIKAVLQ